MTSIEPLQILVICPTQIDYANCQTIANPQKYTFHFLDCTLETGNLSSNFDIMAYLEECREYIRSHEIQVVIATRDIADIIQARLCEEFEHLRGPRVEGAFVCLHKYYTRQYIDPSPIAYTYLIPDSESPSPLTLLDIDIPLPWILKPCTTTMSSLVFKVASDADIQKAISTYNQRLDQMEYITSFVREYIDRQKYRLTQHNLVLVEEYIDYPHKCFVDGCVFKGEIIIWGISDNHYFSSHPECFADFTFPSSLPDSIQEKLKAAYIETVQRLIAYGFDNQFVDVEFFVSDKEEIKIMEINGRMSSPSTTIYRQCLSNGDPYKALIDIGCDRRPETPIPNGLVGGTFLLQTFGCDRAENLLDFELANQMEDVSIRVEKEQDIYTESDGGYPLARVNLVGKSYEQIREKANQIRRQLLKQPELSPWN